MGYNQKGQLVKSDIWVINKMGPLIQILTNPDLEEAVTQASSQQLVSFWKPVLLLGSDTSKPSGKPYHSVTAAEGSG